MALHDSVAHPHCFFTPPVFTNVSKCVIDFTWYFLLNFVLVRVAISGSAKYVPSPLRIFRVGRCAPPVLEHVLLKAEMATDRQGPFT